MTVEFVEAPAFTRHVAAYFDDGELLALQLFLMERPEAGTVMPGTGGFRKLRWTDETRGKGKRGDGENSCLRANRRSETFSAT